MMDIIRLI